MHTYCFLGFQEMALKGGQNDACPKTKTPALNVAADKMEKLVIVVGLIVHIFFKTDAMFLVVFSMGCQF